MCLFSMYLCWVSNKLYLDKYMEIKLNNSELITSVPRRLFFLSLSLRSLFSFLLLPLYGSFSANTPEDKSNS